MKKIETVVITRHHALIAYLREIGLIDESTIVIPHGGEDDVRGRHVIGPVPMRLAVIADRVTEVPIRIPQELRGIELTLEQVREMAGPPRTYVVRAAGERDARMAAVRADIENVVNRIESVYQDIADTDPRGNDGYLRKLWGLIDPLREELEAALEDVAPRE